MVEFNNYNEKTTTKAILAINNQNMVKSLFLTAALHCIFEDPASLDNGDLPEDVRAEVIEIRDHLRMMHKHIVNGIFQCDGVVYGGFVRDTILGAMPHDIDCNMPYIEYIEDLVDYLNRDIDGITFIAQKQTSTECSDYAYSHLIVSTSDMPDVQVSVDVSSYFGNVDSIDFDVNTLIMTDETHILINYGREMPIIDINMVELLQKIREKKFSLLCKDQNNNITTECHECVNFLSPCGHIIAERIQRMVKRGWTLTGHIHCDNPYCILSTEESRTKFIEKLRELHKMSGQFIVDGRFVWNESL